MSETHGIASDHHTHTAPTLAEPKTPMWLPALGAVLFLMVGLIWGLMPESKDASGETGSAATGADAGSPSRQ